MSDWIPMSEQLPEGYRLALVSVNENKYLRGVNTAMLIDGKWYLRLGEEPLKLRLNAWMPLPEPWDETEGKTNFQEKEGQA